MLEEGTSTETDTSFDMEQQAEAEPEPQKSRSRSKAQAIIKSHFLYFYLRSLFPTPKEFDYRWEWNPWTYSKKLLALEETGKNRSKHKQNYPYPLIVILYCWYVRGSKTIL